MLRAVVASKHTPPTAFYWAALFFSNSHLHAKTNAT